MRRVDRTTLLLLIAIGAGVMLRGAAAFSREMITHDEAISYLSATGHQDEYDRTVEGRAGPAGWVTAAELKRLVQLEKKFVLRQIGHDLAVHDFHPPLYFWLLHLWALVIGTHVWTGQLFNALLSAVTAWLLFRFAREQLGDRQSAAVVAATWALSPAVLLSSVEARAYDLMALCTLLMVAPVVRLSYPARPAKPTTLVALAVATTAGLLTHFHFVVIVAGSVIYLTIRLLRNDRRRLDLALAAIGAGGCGFLLAHPRFLWSFRRYGGGDLFVLGELKARLNAVVATLTGFAIYGTLLKAVALVAVAAGLIWMIATWRRRPRDSRSSEIDPAIAPVGFFLLWTGVVIIGLYVAFTSPSHAMGPKYLSPVWPFMAFVPVLVARQLRATSLRVPAAVALVIAGFGVAAVVHSIALERAMTNPSPVLEAHSRLVINNVQAAVLPRVIWHLPDEMLVFAADSKELLRDPAAWLDHLGGNALYISIPDYESTVEQRREVLRLLTEDHHVTAVDGGFWDLGQIYTVRRTAGGTKGGAKPSH
ncbi:MAG TPA: glycosyltransferase family 39 protein [Vicinamibacterales bacterium]